MKNRKRGAMRAKKVEKPLSKDNRPSARSQRYTPEILGIGKTTVGRILKYVSISTFRHVKTTRDMEAERAKRWRQAGEILQLYAGGMRTKRIFWSGETCVDRDSGRRFNPQNNRMYFPKGAKKDEVLGDLRAPLRYRAPGTYARVTASSAQQGVLAGRGLTAPRASRRPLRRGVFQHGVLCIAVYPAHRPGVKPHFANPE